MFILSLIYVLINCPKIFMPLFQECTVKRGPTGDSLGFAFMTFKSSGDVDIIQNNRPHIIMVSLNFIFFL